MKIEDNIMKNPFSLTFGKSPQSMIDRNLQNNEIIEGFRDDPPGFQVCMITGVRGSGKTVALTTIADEFRSEKNWIVVDLNPERDMLSALAAELSNQSDLFELFRDAKINLSVLGFGLEIDGVPPITDITVALERMLQKLTENGKHVLITVDEAVSNQHVREFVSQFQIYLRRNFSLYLLMTGLFENLYEKKKKKSLTFLYRAPKIQLSPLNIGLIAESYGKIFHLSGSESLEMAKVTKGYSFAYQALGYLCFKSEKKWEEILPQFDAILDEYVYEKLWSELSFKDKEILLKMAEHNERKVGEIRENLRLSSNNFTVYRSRLIRKGILYAPEHGYLDFSLPRFREFILRQ